MDFVGKFSLFLGDFPADTYIYVFSRTKFYCVFAEVTSCHVEKYNIHSMNVDGDDAQYPNNIHKPVSLSLSQLLCHCVHMTCCKLLPSE